VTLKAVAWRIPTSDREWIYQTERPRYSQIARADDLGLRCEPLYVQPCPFIRNNGEGTHWCALAAPLADNREVMRMALEALETAQPYVADYCKHAIVMAHNEAITLLRAALGERA
jgi:hypothetical protein